MFHQLIKIIGNKINHFTSFIMNVELLLQLITLGLIDFQNQIWPNPRWRPPLQIKNLYPSQFSTDLDQNLRAPPLR